MKRVAISLAGVALVYLGVMESYYYHQEHLFDPFVGVTSPEIAQSQMSASLRVVAVGGSTTECADLPTEQRYTTVLETRLRKSVPDAVVLNAGRDWYTSRHSLINFVSTYQDWRPQIVIILDAINDLYRSFSPPAFAAGGFAADYRHFYGAAANGAFPPPFEQHLYRLLNGPITTHYWYEAPFVRESAIDYPVERYWSLQPFRSNVGKVINAVRAAGAQPILVTQASVYKPRMTEAEQAGLWFGPAFCATRTGFARYDVPSTESLRLALDAFNEAIREIARSENVLLADAARTVPKDVRHFMDDVHYTAAGAALVASSVGDVIEESLRTAPVH